MNGGPRCSKCGTTRNDLTGDELAAKTPRPPCPRCGETSLSHAIGFVENVGGSASVSTVLTPGEQARGWERRWKEINRDLGALLMPRSGEYSADGIHAAQQDLQSFYIAAFHLKDALIQEAASTGIPKSDVEDAIINTPEVALLADLANLDKHLTLTRRTWSGDIPKIVKISGASTLDGGWQLALEIEHKGKRLDGLEVAKAATEAWRTTLKGWKLI